MVYHPTVDPNAAELREGLEIARAAGAAKIEREQTEAAERERKALAAVDSEIYAEMDRALELFKQCLPLFEARAKAARALQGPLTELLRVQRELTAKRLAAVDELAELRTRTVPTNFKRHVDQLRERALLPDNLDIGLPPAKTDGEAIAETVAMLLDLGILGPGYVRKSVSFPSITEHNAGRK